MRVLKIMIINLKVIFWIKFFNKSKISKINKSSLKNFRKPQIWGSKLSLGMDDDFGFFHTLEAYIQLLDSVKEKDFLDYVELKVGNPKYYTIGNVDLNHHEVSMFYSFKKISSYIKDDHGLYVRLVEVLGHSHQSLKKSIVTCVLLLLIY